MNVSTKANTRKFNGGEIASSDEEEGARDEANKEEVNDTPFLVKTRNASTKSKWEI